MDDVAREGRDLVVSSHGQDWRVGWYPPPDPPAGTPHGAAAVCVSGSRVVLVSSDGCRWGLPGGRPEPGERWAPRFEIAHRRLLLADEALRLVTVAEPTVGPIYRRMFVEAGIAVIAAARPRRWPAGRWC